MSYELTFLHLVMLPLIGAAVAAMGTLVGLGGGFVLVPLLLFMFPDESPAVISSISLTVVFLNAVSATVSHYRERRIDFKTAALLAVGGIPAAAIGAIAASRVTRDAFEVYMGIVLDPGRRVRAVAEHQGRRAAGRRGAHPQQGDS